MFNVSTIGHTTHIKPIVQFLPNASQSMYELKARITEAVATIDNAMLGRIWLELDYRLDMCRVTNAAYIEYL